VQWDHDDRDLVEVRREVLSGGAYSPNLRVGVGRQIARDGPGPDAVVDLGERSLLARVVHEEPVPALLVRTRRCLDRELDTLDDDLAFHGALEVQSLAHGARRRQ
jgi:hypothetical protein